MVKKDKFGKLVKEKMVKELETRIDERPDFIITSFMGSSVSDLEHLRKNLKKASSNYVVVKNSLLKVIFERRKLQDEVSKIESGMGLSLSGKDIALTCKTLVTFAATHDKFRIKGAIIEGKSVTIDRVKVYAALPPRQILLAQVVGGIKSPITGFVNTLSAVIRKFVYVVDAIKTKRESASTEPAPEVKA